MFEVPPVINKPHFNYTALVESYVHPIYEQGVVSDASQKQLLTRFEKSLSSEKFVIITDVATGAITDCKGVADCLGFPDAVFSAKKWAEILHPSHHIFQALYAAAFFDMLKSHPVTFSAEMPLALQTLALRNSNVTYYYCLREIYPYQVSAAGYMMSYLSVYKIIKEYDNEILHWREPLHQKHKWPKAIQKKVKQLFKEYSGFTTREFLLLCRFAGDENLTNTKLATAFKISEGAVQKGNQRLLKRCKEDLKIEFKNAVAAALFFKKAGMIVGG